MSAEREACPRVSRTRQVSVAGVGAAADAVDGKTVRPALGSDYRRLWASAGMSSLADGVVKVALPLVAIGFTRSPGLIAGLSFAVTLPWLVCALPAGALVDRLDRRQAMIGANLARAVLLVLLVVAVSAGAGTIWAMYAVAVCVGTAETVYDTAAQSIMPQIVGRDQLARANGRLYAAELTANQFVGPPLAGLLAGAGAAAAFGAPVALWAIAIAALLLVHGRFRVERPHRTTMRADIAEGLRFLWRHRLLRVLAIMVGTFNFATNAVFAIMVLYAVGSGSVMRLSGQDYGALLAVIAVGSLVGSLAAERVLRALGRSRSLALSLLTGALMIGLPAVTAEPLLIGAAFLLGGAGTVVWNIATVSLRQAVTPDRLLGRVNSCYRLFAWGTMPLGAAAGGLFAQLFGLRAVFAAMAVVVLALLAGLTVATDRAMNAAERDATAQGPSALA